MSGKHAVKVLETIFDACTHISEAKACSRCPLFYNCINDTPFAEVCDMVSIGAFEEFFRLADDPEEEPDMEAYYADLQRKMDAED